MYRSQGARSQGVLKGMLSGPYTGGAREVDLSRLSRGNLRRLSEAFAGRGQAAAFLVERGKPASALVERSLVVAGTALLVGSFLLGFGDRSSRFGLQPWPMLALWCALSGVVSAGVLKILQRRLGRGSTSLPPGQHLLPLDLVDVRPREASGRQIAIVQPLGDVRDARFQALPRPRLHLTFADGRTANFSLGWQTTTDEAQRRLAYTQGLLEDLSFDASLERRVATDPFFDLRVDGSWTGVAPEANGIARVSRLRTPLAAVIAAIASIAIGSTAFAVRNRLGDDALYMQALRDNTPEALGAYLAHGSVRHAIEARGLRDVIAKAHEHRDEAGEPRTLDEAPHGPKTALTACREGLRANRSPNHPEVPAIVEGLLDDAEESGNHLVPIRFARSIAKAPEGLPPMDFESRESTVVWAFERVFSETCPASVLRFSRDADGERRDGLDIRYDVTWPDRAVTVPGATGDMRVEGMRIAFTVTLRGRGERKGSFVLTMRPPEKPSMELRSRSLFVLAGASAPKGVFDERVYRVTTARAFDRLYDELYGLFFAGDVRVPLHGSTSASRPSTGY